MNKRNMLRVADAIEKENLTFDMTKWLDGKYGQAVMTGDSCGTVACVGGTAKLLAAREYWAKTGKINVGLSAEGFLGITHEASDLFYARIDVEQAQRDVGEEVTDGCRYEYITAHRDLVPDALRWMAESGEVDWNKGFKYAACVRDQKKQESVAERTL